MDSTKATMDRAFCAEVRDCVAEVFTRRLGNGVASLSVFGSIATGGPLWTGSDIDVVLVTATGSRADYSAIAYAQREVTGAVGLPVSVTAGTAEDVTTLWSETVRRALCDNAVTVHGSPLSAYLTHQKWDWQAVRRGAVRLACFTRQFMADQYLATLMDSGQDAAAGRILKSAVHSARFAVWSASSPGDRLASHPAEVFAMFGKQFGAGARAHVPAAAFDWLVRGTRPQPEFLAQCVEFADELFGTFQAAHRDLFESGAIFIDPI